MKFHIFNNCLMNENSMSGSDRRALAWTKIFLQKGCALNLYTSKFGKKRYQIFEPNLNLFVINDLNFLPQFPFFIFLERTLRSIFKIKKVLRGDVFYSTSNLFPDALPALIGKIFHRQTKWLLGCHLLADHPTQSFFYFLNQKFVLFLAKYWADLILVSNKLDQKKLVKKGFAVQKLLVAYGGIESEIKKIKVGKKIYEAAFIGRGHPQKGLKDLLQIWRLVCHRLKNAKLLIIGELRPLLPDIKKLSLEKNIELKGFVDGKEKYQLLKLSQVFLFPSIYESFGLVVLEAMACDLPIVGYDIPANNEIWKKGMLKVPLGKIDLFAQMIISLLEDKSRREKLAKEATIYSQQFSWEKTAKAIINKLNN